MGGEASIVSIWLTARELGIPVMSALNGNVYFVQGKIMLAASCMSMLIRKAGHSIQKVVHTSEICTLRGKRRDNGDTAESTFTIEHAKKAGLVKSGGIWEKYAERMLFNRALSNLAKDLFSDCIGTAYVEGEIIEDAEVEEIKPEPLDKESLIFIDTHGLIDLTCPASRFVDSIAVNTGDSRKEVIRKCAKESTKFQKNLDRFIEKTTPAKADIEERNNSVPPQGGFCYCGFMIGYSILYDELVEQDGGCQFYEEPEDKSLISLEMKALSLQKVQLDLPKRLRKIPLSHYRLSSHLIVKIDIQ